MFHITTAIKRQRKGFHILITTTLEVKYENKTRDNDF